MICPKDIRTDHSFMGSVFQNSECETILRNIILLQKAVNPDLWTSFSWDDYKKFCTHNVTDSEKRVLDTFVFGGQPALYASAFLSAGWLDFDGLSYHFTGKIIRMLAENYSCHSEKQD